MEKNILRPPIVVVVGHVDHGKTSLLDAIRKTAVTKREAGGITQSIGATVAETKNGKITFIDTPGHALFTKMRSRGVEIADVAILVVAADDGVQPQTKEAIQILRESNTTFIVALTKVDLATASIETTLGQLEKEGIYFEKRGGDTSWVAVSSKTGQGVDELLELISLVFEVKGVGGNMSNELEGFVIETARDKRGLLVSVVVRSGNIKVGDIIFAGSIKAKIKGLFDSNLKSVKVVVAGYPAQILGFEELPSVGSSVASQSLKTEIQERKQEKKEGSEAKVKIFVKARTVGSLEALLSNIPEDIYVVGSGVGDLTESDVFYSKAGGAIIFLFESKFSSQVRKLTEMEGLKIERFDVVYAFLDRLKELSEKGHEIIVGKAQILAIFPFDGKRVAGSKILQGVITKTQNTKIFRGEKEIGRVRIISIKKQKEEINEAKQGEECGILFAPQLDFQVGDVLVSVDKSDTS